MALAYGVNRLISGRQGETFSHVAPDGTVTTHKGVFFDTQGTDVETDIGDDNARIEFIGLRLWTNAEFRVGDRIRRDTTGGVFQVSSRKQTTSFRDYFLTIPDEDE